MNDTRTNKLISIRGAREHNLKGIDLDLPRRKLIVMTGLSGSGKSSLAFDTVYAEGQRRYVESLSAYARQFLGQMQKPDVDEITGLSPAIAIEQKTSPRNPRSTVGTSTEIYDFLRVLYARIGEPHCHNCGRLISKQTIQQMADRLLEFSDGTRAVILSPLVRGRKGYHRDVFSRIVRDGFVRMRVDGEMMEAAEDTKLNKNKKHTIEVVVDRLTLSGKNAKRLADSLETASQLSGGLVIATVRSEDLIFNEKASCPNCNIGYEELSPRMFSFNSPFGACEVCDGLGTHMRVDPELVVPDPAVSVIDGAIKVWPHPGTGLLGNRLRSVARAYEFSLTEPFEDLPEDARNVLLFGSGDREIKFTIEMKRRKIEVEDSFEGAIPNLERRYVETSSDSIRRWIEGYMRVDACQACGGARLKPEALSVLVAGLGIHQVTAMSVKEAENFFEDLELDSHRAKVAEGILKEIRERLRFMNDVGLTYLTLDRASSTLSGGEAQRIRLATQIGSGLVGVLYILDEPSIGLHQRDNRRLLDTLIKLRDLGNTVIVVEHDRDTIMSADYVVDLGPGAGREGGYLVAEGTPSEIGRCKESLTGSYLTGRRTVATPKKRRQPLNGELVVKSPTANNLKGMDIPIPLGVLCCVTGVSGSGKSTMVADVLYRALAQHFYRSKLPAGAHEGLRGLDLIDKVINISQSPIGRTPRSNPATYTGVFSIIRELYSQLTEARIRGYKAGRFSFNVKGGRCEACQGGGMVKIEMHFLPDVFVTCDVCQGKRYNRETLEVRYKGKNISEVLEMSVAEAYEFFANIPKIRRKLKTLSDVGLGYIHLGQSATTLSGGEAQRVKLAAELSKKSSGSTLYILDEPTTGLHFEDVKVLLEVLYRLVDMGNTVLIIEHNMDVIKAADYIIDLGPEGGDEGGWIVAQGTPEDVAEVERSYTGVALREVL